MSRQMIETADVLIGCETYSEIDQRERGHKCVAVLMRMVRDDLRPTMALCQIPLVWRINQVTAHLPMSEAIAELHRIKSLPGVVCRIDRDLLPARRRAGHGRLDIRDHRR